MPPSASCFCLAVAPERGGLRSHPQNGATRTATANPATDRGIAAGRSALPSRNTTGNLPKTRLFRRFVEGTSPSRLIAQLGVGQTVSCPDGPSPGDPNRGRKGLRFLAVYSFRRYLDSGERCVPRVIARWEHTLLHDYGHRCVVVQATRDRRNGCCICARQSSWRGRCV